MADSMSYPAPTQYIPTHTQYYSAPPPHVNHGPTHLVSPPPRPEPTQRKRPKYTRSKTGCMTCRVKKIKCDETKPNCMRCTHGQRDCTWPEGVPARKKSVVRKDSAEGRPSTAGSSGLSEASASTPPTREHTPPRRTSTDIGLIPLPSRRVTEPYVLHPMPSDSDPSRRLLIANDRPSSSGYAHHPPNNSSVLNMIPETSSYPTQPRYDAYPQSAHPSRHHGFRPLNHEPVAWNAQSEYFPPQDRNLVAAHIANDTHTRYQ
ncbi:putative GAL4-like Zn(II)2Cys6 (or C6 zinc) binuclear cluster DNA-binding domain [Lyophyllum shimeji]|uniref:GAL4-like Zn(II)2Cys6 (Or C6 zinc) binuclear cluster DNA-binding domain n=1 Tax=Lyophyllum shimeji TaxID=47721 RepID=A0A9P3PL06_LYOSH|nr:putative GAL4-like Zn(II)2Cys6 (or C6 zinc) binuclear cluster DNA-binding domain [Lyophyllum shimeji]